MFKLRIFLVSLTLAAVVALLPAAGVTRFAQAGGMWSAWLYNGKMLAAEGPLPELLRIYQDGTTYETELPIPQGSVLYGMPAFNDDGELAAYCILDPQAGRFSLHVQGVGENAASVAEAHQMSIPFTYDLGSAAACEVDQAAFSTVDNSRVAVTVIRYFPGDPSADTSLPAWDLQIVDLKTGVAAHTLAANDETLNALISADAVTQSFIPATTRFGSTLVFRMMPYGMGGGFASDLEAYEWDMDSGAIAPNERYRHATLNLNAPASTETGEVTGPQEAIWTALDETLPVPQPAVPMPAFNTVMYDGGNGAPYPIYQLQDTSLMLGRATFIAGGRYVALALSDPNGGGVTWRAFGRDGALIDLPISEHYLTLLNAPQGYAFMDAAMSARFVYHTIGEDGTIIESVLWESAEPGWSSVWSVPVPGLEGMPAFSPAAQ